MLPAHLSIALVEGLVTAALLSGEVLKGVDLST
jgi:hypothetical protein